MHEAWCCKRYPDEEDSRCVWAEGKKFYKRRQLPDAIARGFGQIVERGGYGILEKKRMSFVKEHIFHHKANEGKGAGRKRATERKSRVTNVEKRVFYKKLFSIECEPALEEIERLGTYEMQILLGNLLARRFSQLSNKCTPTWPCSFLSKMELLDIVS